MSNAKKDKIIAVAYSKEDFKLIRMEAATQRKSMSALIYGWAEKEVRYLRRKNRKKAG